MMNTTTQPRFRAFPFTWFSAMLAWGIHAADSDAVSLGFSVDEYVDFALADRELTFTVTRFDAYGMGEDRKRTHYHLLSNCDAPRRIVASLAAASPTDTSLVVQVDAPASGGSSSGPITLGTSPVEVVTGIGKVNEASIPISYTFRASFHAAIGSFSPEVTYSVIP
jgi:hypothetical protein